nr:MAG TPA: hypothetical protein [Caudoviricetes sp.]
MQLNLPQHHLHHQLSGNIGIKQQLGLSFHSF